MIRLRLFDDMSLCTDAEVERMLPLVPEPRRSQALQFKHTFGRFACLKSYLMLAGLLESEFGIKEFSISVSDHGKPYLTDRPEIHFSISHCRNAIAVAVADVPVGMDVETFRSFSDGLMNKTMNEAERLDILSSDIPQFYSLDQRQSRYAINERQTGEVRLGYVAKKKGSLTIKASRMDQPMLLRDMKLQITHDLSIGDYSFTTDMGTFNNRFMLVVDGNATSVGKLRQDTGVSALAEEGGISFSGIEGQEVSVYSLSGTMLASHVGNGPTSKLTVMSFEFLAGSIAAIVTDVLPAFFGAPESIPVFVSNLSPSGSLPFSL